MSKSINKNKADTYRLNWINHNPDRLAVVYQHLEKRCCRSVREAVDHVAKDTDKLHAVWT